MKKKLEAELISIAHRILKLKNKSELDQLYTEARALYEKLAVLRFAEEHLGEPKPTIGIEDVVDALQKYDHTPASTETPEPEIAAPEVRPEAKVEPDVEIEQEGREQPEAEMPKVPETTELEDEAIFAPPAQEAEEQAIADQFVVEEMPEPSPEPPLQPSTDLPKTTEDELFKPVFEWNFEPKETAAQEPVNPAPQMNFDNLLGDAYKQPEFVKADEPVAEPKKDVIPIDRRADKVQVIKMTDDPVDRSVSLNDRLSRGITVGLNDRIAFVKHLFNNSNEDYNRVLSQLITLDTLDQAHQFIDTMVKPDYNNWEGKEEYVQRFIEVIEKKFN